MIYIATMLFIFQLVVIAHNTLAFLIRQRKYKTWPLLLFYILAAILSLIRMWYIFCVFDIRKNENIYGYVYKSYVKIDLGLTQCWIVVELALLVRQSINFTRLFTTALQPEEIQSVINKKQKQTNNIIKYGRIILVIVITCNLTAMFIYFAYIESTTTLEERN